MTKFFWMFPLPVSSSLVRGFILGFSALLATGLIAAEIDLSAKEWRDVTFDDIPATKFATVDGALEMKVERSAAIRLLPFQEVKKIAKISWLWRIEGAVGVPNAAAERTKAGDDAALRVGLIVSGKAPWIPFFAPAWIKALREYMHLPTNRLVYLLPGSKQPVGTKWPSPYSDSIENIAVPSETATDGWQKVSYTLPEVTSVVGLWLMADGDDSKSSFTTKLKSLSLD